MNILTCEAVLIGGARRSQLQYSPVLPQPPSGLWSPLEHCPGHETCCPQECSQIWVSLLTFLMVLDSGMPLTEEGPKVRPPHDLRHVPSCSHPSPMIPWGGWKLKGKPVLPCLVRFWVLPVPSTGLDPLRHPHGVTPWFTNRVAGSQFGVGDSRASGPFLWTEAGVVRDQEWGKEPI